MLHLCIKLYVKFPIYPNPLLYGCNMNSYGDALLSLKRRFLIIGLTGYTSSGCSTAARLLSKNKKPKLPGIKAAKNIDDSRRYNKLKRIWSELTWQPFVKIEISYVILLFIISRAVHSDIEETPITVARMLAEKFPQEVDGIDVLLDRDTDVRDEHLASKIVSAYEKFRPLYIEFKKNVDMIFPHSLRLCKIMAIR